MGVVSCYPWLKVSLHHSLPCCFLSYHSLPCWECGGMEGSSIVKNDKQREVGYGAAGAAKQEGANERQARAMVHAA